MPEIDYRTLDCRIAKALGWDPHDMGFTLTKLTHQGEEYRRIEPVLGFPPGFRDGYKCPGGRAFWTVNRAAEVPHYCGTLGAELALRVAEKLRLAIPMMPEAPAADL